MFKGKDEIEFDCFTPRFIFLTSCSYDFSTYDLLRDFIFKEWFEFYNLCFDYAWNCKLKFLELVLVVLKLWSKNSMNFIYPELTALMSSKDVSLAPFCVLLDLSNTSSIFGIFWGFLEIGLLSESFLSWYSLRYSDDLWWVSFGPFCYGFSILVLEVDFCKELCPCLRIGWYLVKY